MTEKQLNKYRDRLRAMAARIIGDTTALEENARASTGGEAGGNLSNTPMHLADLGTEVYLQELNSTLLENQEALRDDILAALHRIEEGSYGQCESCGNKIPDARLNVVPFTRVCTNCAAAAESGHNVNFNAGRPPRSAAIDDRGQQNRRHSGRKRNNRQASEEFPAPDIHAAGTPGGGSAVGGLAGTNAADGDPDNVDLENAMGSSAYDVAIEGEDGETNAYSGHSGGAVGGTPAGKRAVGGTRRGGRRPS